MNQKRNSSAKLDLEIAIDRLVANEANPADRRALLMMLDATPDGWRRCALAFLEDQAWRSALDRREVLASLDRASHQKSRRKPPSSGLLRPKLIQYAMAASLAVAGGIAGFRAGVASVERDQPREVAVVRHPFARTVQPELEPEPEPPTEPGQPIGWISLVDPAEGEAMPRPVPVLAATQANDHWLKDQPATIPDYVRAQWERRGYLIGENHRLVGLNLDDGRQVAIPVNEVDLDYVGRQPL